MTEHRNFHYTYILESIKSPGHYYSGYTKNLEDRLNTHNKGKCAHTDKFRPWRIKTAIAFTDHDKALEFERYLKTASGRAFAKKRL